MFNTIIMEQKKYIIPRTSRLDIQNDHQILAVSGNNNGGLRNGEINNSYVTNGDANEGLVRKYWEY